MDATHIKNIILAALSVLIAFVTKELGGCDAAMKALIALMVADYLTGVLIAAFWKCSSKSKSGTLNSRAGFKGLCRKGIMLLLVWIGVLLDNVMGSTYIRMTVILFFIGNEGLSLLENVGLMGVPYPEALKRALESLQEKEEKKRE